jgi:hypothetical protein
MVEYTIEQLVAKGLTEEEAKAYLETLKEKEKTTKIPFEIAKVFYSVDKPELVGHLVAGVEKDDDGEIVNVKYDFGTKPEIRVLKTMAQHTKYDATEGKVVVSSNIVPIKQSRKAIDLKTGKLITEMKKEIPDIKYQMVVLLEVKDIKTKEWIPCVMYMKGKFLYEFNQNVKTNDYINNIVKFELKKMKKGSVVYYVPINFELTSLSEEETFKCMVRDAKNIKKYDEWVNGVNSKDKEENEDVVNEVAEDIYESDNPFENV